MMLLRRTAPVLLLPLVMAACTPAAHPTPTSLAVQQLAATMAASMINTQTAATEAASSSTPAAPVATPTIKPTLFISASEANCLSGPGPDYQVITSLAAGTTVDLIAKDTAEGYWVVLDPATHSQCWVNVQDATPTGSFDLLPEVTAEPITMPVPVKPEAAGSPDFMCDNSSLTVILYWFPPPGPVNGYRVFREGVQVADVPASQTKYTEKTPFRYGSSVAYAVAAYNDAGLSPQRTWNVHCP
jgi:hypothetical protein